MKSPAKKEIDNDTVLDHFSQKVVDFVFPVAEVAALNEVVGLLPPAAGRGVQLERPQEVGGIPEVGSDGKDFVDEVLDTDEVVLALVGQTKLK